MEERFWFLASLKLSGEATPEEHQELADLLRAHPQLGLQLELFTNLWRQQPASQKKPGAFNRHLQRLSTHLAHPALQYEKPPRRLRPFALAIAASLTGIVLLLGLYKWTRGPETRDGYNTVSTRPGSRSKIQLPDGTLVWLNADSRLAYKVDGAGPNREVQLTGEAYFDVARDKTHPFLIHTATIDVRVLGTSFNVRSYSNEKNTETSLFQGSVEVSLHNNPERRIILRPYEKLTIHNNELAVSTIKTKTPSEEDPEEPLMTLGKVHFQQQDSSYTEMLWTKNKLAFDNSSLEEVALQLERWYGATITFSDPRLKATRFSGVFEDESLAQVMHALELTGDFHYTIHKKEVSITP
jgi:transmembrane sensor